MSTIANLLLKNTSIDKTQLDAITNYPRVGGGNIGDYLERMQPQNPEEALKIICEELDLEFMRDIPINEVAIDLVRNIPINYSKNHEVLPYKDEGNVVSVLLSNPINMEALTDLRAFFNKNTRAIITTSSKLQDAINKVYEKSTAALDGLDEIEGDDYDLDEPIVDLLDSDDDDAPVIRLVNTLLFRAVKEKASDIHIEPYERELAVRFRIDGQLYDVFKPPKKLQNSITSRIKVMANLNIAEKRLPQDGRIPLKLAGKDIDIRLSTVPTAFGERLVMRLQDRSSIVLDLNQLGFPEDALQKINALLEKSYGIILVTGPTGSGKSTTLYSCINRIVSPDRNIITVEDPVEQRIQGIGQIQVNSKIGLTFAQGLRSILRQDPDVIMVGEIRDYETAEISINASLTGHLVLSTLHTNDSAGAIPRLLDMGCEPFLISSSVVGVIAQRLVRLLCPHCKAPHQPSEADLLSLEITPEMTIGAKFFKAIGCNQCNQKGYSGRTVISELMIINDEIRQLILLRKDGGTIKKASIKAGMRTVRLDGVKKVLLGITTIEEVLQSTQTDD
jgi:general secretion pathway protein E